MPTFAQRLKAATTAYCFLRGFHALRCCAAFHNFQAAPSNRFLIHRIHQRTATHIYWILYESVCMFHNFSFFPPCCAALPDPKRRKILYNGLRYSPEVLYSEFWATAVSCCLRLLLDRLLVSGRLIRYTLLTNKKLRKYYLANLLRS